MKSPILMGACCIVEVFAALFVLLFFIGIIGGPGSSQDNANGDPSGSGYTDSGDLSNVTEVPASLKPIFVAAAKKHKISPAFLAAIFWKEHGRRFPTKGPWASSPAGANGPFQFIEKTWEGWSCNKTNNSNGVFESDPSKICGYGQDGNGDGKADVQNLTDAAFAAAELLGKNGAAPNVTDLDKLRNVASRYNSGKPWSKGKNIPETANYVPDVIKEYQKIVGEM